MANTPMDDLKRKIKYHPKTHETCQWVMQTGYNNGGTSSSDLGILIDHIVQQTVDLLAADDELARKVFS